MRSTLQTIARAGVVRSISPLVLCACLPEAPFTSAERENLDELVLRRDLLPDDPSDAWADDPAAARLGQAFFYDTGFSGPLAVASDLGEVGELGRVGCVSCHDPGHGGTDHRSGGPTSHGAGWTARNAPSVVNSALSPWMFWDGRRDTQWAQALGPSEAPNEENSSRLHIAHSIFERYRSEYEAVFGAMPDLSDPAVFPPDDSLCGAETCLGKPGDAVWDAMSADAREQTSRVFANYGKALEAYERLLITTDAPFDAFMRGDSKSLEPAAIRGARLFVGRAACNECHRGPALADGKFHNLGVPQSGDALHGLPEVDEGRALGVAEVLDDEFNAAGPFSDAPEDAEQLDGLEPRPEDLGAFKTPTLRNVALTAPYMHNGAFDNLWDVVAFYTFGGDADGGFGVHDPAIQPLALSDDDLHDLVAFLESLTGSLPADLTSPPVQP